MVLVSVLIRIYLAIDPGEEANRGLRHGLSTIVAVVQKKRGDLDRYENKKRYFVDVNKLGKAWFMNHCWSCNWENATESYAWSLSRAMSSFFNNDSHYGDIFWGEKFWDTRNENS